MFFTIDGDDVVRLFVDGVVKAETLHHLIAAVAAAGDVAVDILPGAGVGEGEMVGRDAHDGAVLFVQGLGVEGLVAEDVADGEGKGGGALDEGTWVGG